MNLSFAGCGFLGIYHVGVAACFRKYAPHLLLHKISGASAGALAACCLLCDLPLGDMTSDVLRVAGKARTSILGPFSPSFNVQEVLIEGLKRYLPEDAHIRVSGKLFISMTRVCDGKNVIISNYECRDDLIDALLASAFIPFFSGIVPPKYHGVRYMDGGFSDNLPQIDENTITVSPFCGESDICPRDESSQLFHINFSNTSIELSKQNIYRLVRILFPPKPEILSNMCKQGFDDALRFLHRNNLINCTRCLAIQSTYVVSETIDENFEYDPQCKECKVHIEEALVSNIPDTVMTILQDAIESANKGIVNWVFKHRGMKILSILSLPYALPADIVYATFTKFLAAAPKMKHNLWEMSRFLIDQLVALFNMNKNKHDYSNSTLSCHLAISEYGGTKYDLDANSIAVETKNQMNLNFTLNLDENEHHKTLNSRRYSTNNILGRNQNLPVHKSDGFVDDDTFEHILEVTSHHETVMAYYYMDENNKVKVTEIFDVTDSECEAVQSSYERERNTQLQFDDEWDDSTWLTTQSKREDDYFNDQDSITGLSITSMEEILECDSNGIFSDPESEWNGTIKIEIPDENDLSTDADLRPESDQPCQMLRKPYTIPSSVVFDSLN